MRRFKALFPSGKSGELAAWAFLAGGRDSCLPVVFLASVGIDC